MPHTFSTQRPSPALRSLERSRQAWLSIVRVRAAQRKPQTSRSSSCLVNTHVGSLASVCISANSCLANSTGVWPTWTWRLTGSIDSTPMRTRAVGRRS